MKVSALREMITRIVREEVAKALKEGLAEALSRNYIREIVAESSAPRQRQATKAPPARRDERQASSIVSELVRKHALLGDDFDDDDEELPRSSSPLLERANPLRSIYEGTEPLPEDNARQPGDFDVDLGAVGFAGSDVLKRMAGL